MYAADTTLLWSSGTQGNSGVYATMQADGNFVVYDKNNKALWHTHTYTQGASILKMQDDGNLVVYRNSDNGYTWYSATQFNGTQIDNYIGTQLASGARLNAGDYLRSSDYRYTLVMQSDGNLVLYSADRHTVLWFSHTQGNLGAYATMQADGNFVVYDKNNNALWHTYTYNQGASVIKLQTDGNLVIYRNADNGYTWYSNTVGSF
jgi:hypothetical protein